MNDYCDYQNTAPPPRTPADIGRDIKRHQDFIDTLKVELAQVPPRLLILPSVHNAGDFVEFDNCNVRAPRICVTRRYDDRTEFSGLQVGAEGAARLRAWLNHYYPEATS